MGLTDDIKELNVLTEAQINDSFEIKKIMSSINMMSEASINKFVNNFQKEMGIPFNNVLFMDLDIKTVSFGGYDKKATETYIMEQQKHYEGEISNLKEDATKLSEAVKGLQQMREANMSESKSTIHSLRINVSVEVNSTAFTLTGRSAKHAAAAGSAAPSGCGAAAGQWKPCGSRC